MFDLFISLLFGFVQGVTEFLPISSSGHLLLLHEVFDLQADSLSFDAALHLGTLLAVLIFFMKDIRTLSIAFFRSFTKHRTGNTEERLPWLILFGSIPAVIVGYFFEDIIESVLRSPHIVVVTLIVGGLLFFGVERYGKKLYTMQQINWKTVLGIGVAQALALIPGVSRSGITITAGMVFHLTRYEAARFSFLLSIPAVFGAGMKKLYDLVSSGANEYGIFVVGIISSFVFGILAIQFLLKFTQKHSLNGFGIYRIVLALAVLALLIL